MPGFSRSGRRPVGFGNKKSPCRFAPFPLNKGDYILRSALLHSEWHTTVILNVVKDIIIFFVPFHYTQNDRGNIILSLCSYAVRSEGYKKYKKKPRKYARLLLFYFDTVINSYIALPSTRVNNALIPFLAGDFPWKRP